MRLCYLLIILMLSELFRQHFFIGELNRMDFLESEFNNSESESNKALLSQLPSISQLLQTDSIVELSETCPEQFVTNSVRHAVNELRQSIINGNITDASQLPSPEKIASRVAEIAKTGLSNKLMRVINGAGVILHTGLGRAPLAASAQEALKEAAARYCLLATDRESGRRGDRNSHTEELLCELTGAESALVVNNNSAAVILALNTFGEGKESVVSRGELVEIGGSFRMPDVMSRSGTIMVEVGTTNKTHLRDYHNAITPETTILLKVHTSNYRIEGFHKEVPLREMTSLAHEHGLIVVMDIGSGALVDIRRWGLPYEPTVPEAIADGADIVSFSGDKMLGGPQSGIVVGRRDLVDRMKKNPLMRALRCDKLILSALDGMLRLFLAPDRLPETHPVYKMLTAPMDLVNRRARRIARRLKGIADSRFEIRVTDGITEMGSGSLPARGIQTRVVSIGLSGISTDKFARELRRATPPLFTRIEDDRVIIDARTVADDEVGMIASSFQQAIKAVGSSKG